MPTFAQIQEEIGNMMAIPEEELTEEQKWAMDEYLDLLGQQESDKIDSFAQFARLQADSIESVKAEARRLMAKAKTMEGNLESLRRSYLFTMQNHGLKKVRGDVYTVSIRESVAVDAPQTETSLLALKSFNPEFVRVKTEYSANKQAIKEALKAGVAVPACRLVTNMSLQIR